MNIKRIFDVAEAVSKKTIFLFGPRQTGKSWLIRNTLSDHLIYNLLDSETFQKLQYSHTRIREEYLAKRSAVIIIDEIQRIPQLLNEVHLMIEEYGVHFVLTGSSARKLRHKGVNLLGGRAHVRYLHPFNFIELQENFDLNKAINFGLLPSIYFSQTPQEDLQSYVGLYLREEIAAEGLIRNVPAFSRFLEIAALCNGKIINYTKIANDAQVARTTVQEYFQILQDTLIARELPAWKRTHKRKPIERSKYYLFDCGVTRALQNRNILNLGTPEFGDAFEQYMFHELQTYVDYNNIQDGLHYWRSISGFDVDFILSQTTAIEVKSSKNITRRDLKNLLALKEEKQLKNYIVVSLEETARIVDDIQILPWKVFLARLWHQEFHER